MKKNLQLIILIAALFITAFAKAQTSGGPDGFGYTWKNNLDVAGPVYNWIDISSRPGVVTVAGLGDDNIKGPFAITIPFHYYWYDPANFWVGSNGYIGFTSSPVAAPFPSIPTTATPNDWLAVMASDLTFTDNGGLPIPGATCQYWQGTDSLIVTWTNVPFWDQPAPGYLGNNTFQVILSTVDSSITYQYFDQTGIYVNPTNFMEQGIENNSGSIGLEYFHDTYPLSSTSVKFYYPASVTIAINDAATSFVNNPGSKGIILARGMSAFTSSAEVKNAGNQTLPSFDSYSRIVNTGNIIQLRDTITVTNLAPAATQFLTYPDVWSPTGATAAGKYRQINTTILAGDATPSNNVDTLELWLVDPTLASVSLQWDNGTVGNSGGVSWQGGGGGIAQHFVPPYYPCVITAVGATVISDLGSHGYNMQIFADDGPNGAPLTELDSINVAPGTFTANIYYQVSTTSAITINSGGFYVAWMMGGDSIALAEDNTTPHSHQSFEILGAASNPNSWAEYRGGALQDPIIHAIISGFVNVNEITAEPNRFGQFYPNPAQYKTSLQYNLKESSELNFSLYDLQGKLVSEKNIGKVGAGDGMVELYLQKLDAGVYVCKITAGSHEYHKKITVVR